jgi:gas vesicle protein
MGEQFGPEAKKIVDDTWKQAQDILKGGVGVGTVDQLRRLIQDKTQEVRKVADQAWQKGLEQAKPYLDYSPKVRELVIKNKETLMQGNLTELWEEVQIAAKSGDTSDLEKFIEETADRGKNKLGGSGGGLDQYFNMVPGGSEIIPKCQQLKELTEKHGEEAERLVKEAFKEIQEVLRRKVEEAQELVEKATKQ